MVREATLVGYASRDYPRRMQEDALDDESTLRFPRSDLPLLEYSVDRSTALPKGIQRRAVGIDR